MLSFGNKLNSKQQEIQEVAQESKSELEEAVRKYEEAIFKYREAQKKVENHLSWLTSQRPDYLKNLTEADKAKAELARLKAEVEAAAKEEKRSIDNGVVTVKFSEPQTTKFDVETLIRECPSAEAFPGLIIRTVDERAFRVAVATGIIPKNLAARVEQKVPATKAGRVRVSADWDEVSRREG